MIKIDGAHLTAFTLPDLLAGAVTEACDAIARPPVTSPRRRFTDRVKQLLRRRRLVE